MKKLIVLFSLLSISLCAGLTVKQEIIQGDNYFRTHPDHKIPEKMVIQNFQVKLTPSIRQKGNLYCYKLLKSTPGSKLQNPKNSNKFGASPINTFKAGAYGLNVVGVYVKNSFGKVIGKTTVKIFVHFSRSQLAGGDVTKLDSKYADSKKYITGVFDEVGKPIYNGLRYFPQSRKNLDMKYEGSKLGFYETKEPRIFKVEKSKILIATYHAQVKGRNDAPPGLTIVVSRSLDGGTTWQDEQVIDHDVNGVIGYTALAQVGRDIHLYVAGGVSGN